MWVFHGDVDESAPVSESRKMTEALKSIGGNAHYTESPGVPHNSWDLAYNNPEFPAWLFAQRFDETVMPRRGRLCSANDHMTNRRGWYASYRMASVTPHQSADGYLV